MNEQFSRTERLLGTEAMQKLAASHVAVFGIGGVGGFAVEALVRAGIGAIDLIDNDTVAVSNLNRQIIATRETIGRPKVEVMRERIAQICPDTKVRTFQTFYLPETADQFDFREYDYIIDAIDTVSGKISIVMQAYEAGTPVISSMGTGNKLDPTALEVSDIYRTSVCPLAKVMRTELKKRGIPRLKVVYSREMPITPLPEPAEDQGAGAGPGSENVLQSPGGTDALQKTGAESSFQSNAGTAPRRKRAPASISFVPSAAGLILAGEVIKDLTGIRGNGIGG